jgi:hypothetical protein
LGGHEGQEGILSSCYISSQVITGLVPAIPMRMAGRFT